MKGLRRKNGHATSTRYRSLSIMPWLAGCLPLTDPRRHLNKRARPWTWTRILRPFIRRWVGCISRVGKSQESVQEFRRALQLSGSNDIYLRSDLAFACAVTGNRKEAEKAITDLKSLHAQGLVPSGS